jgi:Na+-translocating ferredoxin:NAD+ oxidoreductase RnfE subunit
LHIIEAMKDATQDTISILHNKVPNRIRIRVPLIKHKQTYADLLKQSLLTDAEGKGIYHAEPNIVTGTMLVKFHPACHSEEEVIRLITKTVSNLHDGKIEITQKHKNPKLGKMPPGAFFTRELLVSIVGNIVAGIFLAVIVTG